MRPDWFNAHVASILLRTFNAGIDFAVEKLKLEKKEKRNDSKRNSEKISH